jgi:hypothetical protein
MATHAMIVGLDQRDAPGTDALINASWIIVDSTAQTALKGVAADIACPMATPGTWKGLIVAAVIADAAVYGYTVTAPNVRYPSTDPGDYKRGELAVAWTKDITKTNIGTSLVNVYIGSGGEGQLFDVSGYNQYRLVVSANKVGTGNLTHGVAEVGGTTNRIESTYTGAAGEFTSDSGWTDLPAWATGEHIVRPMALSTVATDDPVYRSLALYIR